MLKINNVIFFNYFKRILISTWVSMINKTKFVQKSYAHWLRWKCMLASRLRTYNLHMILLCFCPTCYSGTFNVLSSDLFIHRLYTKWHYNLHVKYECKRLCSEQVCTLFCVECLIYSMEERYNRNYFIAWF